MATHNETDTMLDGKTDTKQFPNKKNTNTERKQVEFRIRIREPTMIGLKTSSTSIFSACIFRVFARFFPAENRIIIGFPRVAVSVLIALLMILSR
jgi:hypothetical protein